MKRILRIHRNGLWSRHPCLLTVGVALLCATAYASTPIVLDYRYTTGNRLDQIVLISDDDSDGSDNRVEETIGTGRYQVDSDGDGFSDGQEDKNRNERVDAGESDPRPFTPPREFLWGPTWWHEFGVLETSAPRDDYAVANVGQLKCMAQGDYGAMQAYLSGGAGAEITALVNSFTANDDYAAANVGQVKQIAKPFYDRCGLAYRWAASANDDYAAVNVGQLKQLFSFDLD